MNLADQFEQWRIEDAEFDRRDARLSWWEAFIFGAALALLIVALLQGLS